MASSKTTLVISNVSAANSTFGNPKEFSYTDVDWIVPTIINALLILLALWITFSVTHYGIKTDKWCTTAKRKSQQLSAGVIYSSVVLCAVMTILRYVTSFATFHLGIGEGKDYECEIISDMSFAMYCLVTACVYLFLWLRQRTFYANKMLNVSYNRFLRFVSASSFLVIFFSGLGAIVVTLTPVSYPSSARGCTYKPSFNIVETIGWAVSVALLVLSQLVLIALFVYPLMRHRKMQEASAWSGSPKDRNENVDDQNKERSIVTVDGQCDVTSTTDAPVSSSSPKKKVSERRVSRHAKQSNRPYSLKLQRKIMRIMLRTIIFSVLSIVSDIWWLVFSTYILNTSGPRRWSTTAYDINVMFNLLSVICSFLAFPMMLTSPLRNHSNQEVTSAVPE
uniref:uncharacterized protein LOC108951117 n=1 Tax=Ciona intestinalis TaxID=7719 RepID=UPI00089DBD4E|nr:uncharacterized protein LOC108951117 [Ciona intestinalis]XP_026689683.1 uncharacterized protein LOC108951117 [Ciona intestinalis]|eukprot:XP_018673399.1 uncharacterized protein LOC108951117 [Ciona intestinalis]